MFLTHFSPADLHVRVRGWVLAFMLTTCPPVHAANPGASSVPPAYPDSQHVLNGCFISTLAFIARFRADFPAERAQPLTVSLKTFYGMHTIAVMSWRGWWWGRDEFFGVFAIDRRVAKYPDPEKLVARVEKALAEYTENEVASGRGEWAPPPPQNLTTAERTTYVSAAAAMSPVPSEIFWVLGRGAEIPLLFFRPSPGLICVYDPLTGTAQAQSDTPQPAKLVRAFAARLGYHADEVRAGLAVPHG